MYSRDGVSGLWWDNAQPWYYETSNNNQIRPDLDPVGTRNNVFIGHNSNTTMTVNGTWFALRTLTLQSSASSNRIFNTSDGGGISLSVGFTSDSAGSHTFNVPIGVDGSSVAFTTNSGSVSFTQNFYLNANTAVIGGAGNTSISGTISGSAGSNLIKDGSGTLTLTGTNTSFLGATTIKAGTVVAGNVDVFGPITNPLYFDGPTATLKLSGTVNNAARPYVMLQTGIIDTAGFNLTHAGIISGPGGLTKTGAARWCSRPPQTPIWAPPRSRRVR